MDSCSYCYSPNPKSQCGYACGQAAYCGQECADKDWVSHFQECSREEVWEVVPSMTTKEVIEKSSKVKKKKHIDANLSLVLIAGAPELRKRSASARRFKMHIRPTYDIRKCPAGTDGGWGCRVYNGWGLKLFHQTNPEAAKSIVKSQTMFPGKKGYVGGGIYFALSPQETERKAESKGVMLFADVYVGRMLFLIGPRNTIDGNMLYQLGFDSVWTNLRSGPEVVVYWQEQVTNIQIWFPKYGLPGRPTFQEGRGFTIK